MRPLRRLAETADEIGRTGDLERRLPPAGSRDLLGLLTGSFNGMLERLADSRGQLTSTLEGQRAFLAEVSHELRSPLTTIRSNAGFLRERPEVARRLIWAHLDGLNFMRARPQTAAQAMSQTPGNTLGIRTYQAAIERVGLDDLTVPIDALRGIIEDYRQLRLLNRALTPDSLTDYSLQNDYTYTAI